MTSKEAYEKAARYGEQLILRQMYQNAVAQRADRIKQFQKNRNLILDF
jgi:hypothetical protein